MGTFRATLRLLFCAFLSFAPFSFAQSPSNGEIRLQVTDSSGAVMQASGTLKNSATGATVRSFQTDTKGAFDFTGLGYGRYRLEVSQRGFNTESISLDVQSATPISRKITMT